MKTLLLMLFCTLPLTACDGDNSSNETVPQQQVQAVASQNQGESSAQLEDQLALLPLTELTTEQEQGLLLMREEEKLARDVYLALYNLHGLPVFNNIAQSEQRHMDAVKVSLDRYQLADPAASLGYGSFANPELEQLYSQLIDQGMDNLTDALKVGLLIEELDLYDLQRLQQQVAGIEAIFSVYDNLMKGSRNHLRSFYWQLTLRGETYQPSYLSQEVFEAIANSEMERGNSL